MAFRDLTDYFGAPYARQQDADITIGGIHTGHLLEDINTIWHNTRLNQLLFKEIRKYRLVVDRFYLPDIDYVLSQIQEFKKRKSSKYRVGQVRDAFRTDTWLKSTVDEHPDILDFTQLARLKHSLYEHQVDTLKVYNTKVPKMQLKGFLLSTPAGCLTGDSEITFIRGGRMFSLSLQDAYAKWQQHGDPSETWDLAIPTYVRAYTGALIQTHPIEAIVYSGVQEVYRVHLLDGRIIKCTADHEIMTDQGFIPAYAIVGCKVMCDDLSGTPHYLEATSFAYIGHAPTYDIRCCDPHRNFVADAIVVHNSGKTIMSIGLSACLHADVSFYVVPKSTVDTVWFDGIIEELGPKTRIWAVGHGQEPTLDYDHYIFNFEALPLAIYLAKRLHAIRRKPFIAIDESHNLNEINSLRTLRLIELSKTLDCQHTIFASGTPIKALGTEMIPLLRTIDPMFSPEVETSFKQIYGLTAKRANDILRNRLGLISHKIAESSYMSIPPPIEQDYFITIPNPKPYLLSTIKADMQKFMKDRYAYYSANLSTYIRNYNVGLDYYAKTLTNSRDKAEFAKYREQVAVIITGYDPFTQGDILKAAKLFETQKIIPILPANLKNNFKDALSVVKFTKARVIGEALGILERRRGECAAELVKWGHLENLVLEADKKTIIFSSHIPALEYASKYFTEQGFKILQVYGPFTKDLTNIVNKFKQDPDTNPMIATFQSLSASQTLTVANVVIFLNATFREYTRNQAFHRIFRIGQLVQTYVFQCLLKTSEPNVSTRSDEILKWSQEMVKSLMSDSTPAETAGIVKRLHLNPPTGLTALLEMIRNVNPFSR